MAGYENIKDANNNRTPSERRELAKMAGKASGEARKRQANFRKNLNKILTTEIDHPEWTPLLKSLGLDSTLETAMLMAQVKEAMLGNTKAAYFVAQYAGQSGKTEADEEEQNARVAQTKAHTERMANYNVVDEDDGIEVINDAPTQTSEDIGYSDSEILESV